MSTYGLLEYSKDIDNPQHKHKAQSTGNNYMLKDLFKDTRLNKLWAKAELTGFTRTCINLAYFVYDKIF